MTNASQRLLDSISRKLQIINFINNPILGAITVIAILASFAFLQEIINSSEHILIYFHTTFWLWMTVLLSIFADGFAESMAKYKHYSVQDLYVTHLVRKLTLLKKKDSLDNNIIKFNTESYKSILVDQNKIKSGDLILLTNGDIVPLDGILVSGSCYVNESDLTGTLGQSLKTSEEGSILTAGSIIDSLDHIIVKITFSKRFSFYARTKHLIKAISRQSLPSELALQRITFGFSILFLCVIFTVWIIAKYSGYEIPFIYILDLIVLLLPTTFSGLQRAIIRYGTIKLQEKGIFVRDNVALDNAVDVNVVLFDKTGTITVGKREMTSFVNISDFDDENFLELLYLASLHDTTNEGQSIRNYTENREAFNKLEVVESNYTYFSFSSSKPISGCDYKGIEIRKGSVKAISEYLKIGIDNFPAPIKEATHQISSAHGTPLIVTIDKHIIGVIQLRDRFRKGIKKQLDKFHELGIKTALLTGDNVNTANYVAKKMEIDEVYADATPEDKLDIVRELQQQGYIVAMCGDGINDSLALAQADVGFSFEDDDMATGNVISNEHDLSKLLELKNICKRMTVKRGEVTVFSLTSDLTKYFVIIPSLFSTVFPPLEILNFMRFHSLDSVILSSVIFNALIIPALMPLVFDGFNKTKTKYSLWKGMLLYGLGGIISPFIFIKLIEIVIYNLSLLW
ncbi:MAG: HAD-IC family P-type ATPase [Rickettsiales bacterium]|nr:HAD-IC family P-type ATPase [Rickettsiales bacterium]MCA0254114.1 HAD-IC family P-type ATPase [Pseudomonadota bacterium]